MACGKEKSRRLDGFLKRRDFCVIIENRIENDKNSMLRRQEVYMIKLIPETRYEKLMQTVVEPGLAAMREEIDMPLAGGGVLHAEVYNRYDAKAAVVILHGYTESAEKFRELTWYMIGQGYSVFAMDHRGHGRSVREVEDLSVTHVNRFTDYLKDLEQFMEEVVKPRMGGRPLYLFGHSMGGALAAFALIAHPEWFVRAVLNAPMIAPVTAPFPRRFATLLCGGYCLLGRGKERAFVGKPFDPAREKFDTSHMTSKARFDYYQKKRCARPELQNCSPTYSWLREATAVTEPLMKGAKKIAVPVLLCQAAQDSIVGLEEQNAFIARVPQGRLVSFDAKHEIYSSCDEVLVGYYEEIARFFDGK